MHPRIPTLPLRTTEHQGTEQLPGIFAQCRVNPLMWAVDRSMIKSSRTGVPRRAGIEAQRVGRFRTEMAVMAAVEHYVESYRQLSEIIHEARLLRRRRGFYLTRIIIWLVVLAGLLTAVVVFGATWFQLFTAGLIGMVMAQLGFLSHEAAHREVFASRAWNEWTSRIIAGLFMGLSFSWWMAKHNTHHAYPN